jgi:hypothetical protein
MFLLRYSPWLILASLGLPILTQAAPSAYVENMGRTDLVLEDETTTLSLFNYRNPAGLAFLGGPNRVDLQTEFNQRTWIRQFTTGAPNSPESISPAGNTLPGYTVLTSKTLYTALALNDEEAPSYSGCIFSLLPELMMQLSPGGSYSEAESKESLPRYASRANALLRSAWRYDKQSALGIAYTFSRNQEAGQIELSPLPLGAPLSYGGYIAPGLTQYQVSSQGLTQTLTLGWGGGYSQVFDESDELTVGLAAEYGQKQLASSETGTLVGASPWQADSQSRREPWCLEAQGLYRYLGAMDIGLCMGLDAETGELAWSNGPMPDQSLADQFSLSHLFYNLAFRLRLPLVREDDLRFGIEFSNQGQGHPLPAGKLHQENFFGSAPIPDIETAASAIGIGTAFVPVEGSLLAFQYRLGSSKSKQDGQGLPDDLLLKTGFAELGIGVQYRLVEQTYLRFGYTNQRLAYETRAFDTADPDKVVVNSRVDNISGYHAGLGFTWEGASLDLAFRADRILPSPKGWRFTDKPSALQNVDKDEDLALSSQLRLSWFF